MDRIQLLTEVAPELRVVTRCDQLRLGVTKL
jgi:hypothetical protein